MPLKPPVPGQTEPQYRQAGLRGDRNRHLVRDLQAVCAVEFLVCQKQRAQRPESLDIGGGPLGQERVACERQLPDALSGIGRLVRVRRSRQRSCRSSQPWITGGKFSAPNPRARTARVEAARATGRCWRQRSTSARSEWSKSQSLSTWRMKPGARVRCRVGGCDHARASAWPASCIQPTAVALVDIDPRFTRHRLLALLALIANLARQCAALVQRASRGRRVAIRRREPGCGTPGTRGRQRRVRPREISAGRSSKATSTVRVGQGEHTAVTEHRTANEEVSVAGHERNAARGCRFGQHHRRSVPLEAGVAGVVTDPDLEQVTEDDNGIGSACTSRCSAPGGEGQRRILGTGADR